MERAPSVPTWETTGAAHSPLLHYPWKQTWETLQRLAPEVDGSPFDGVIMEYTNPNTGGPVMPTIACHIQMLRPGEATRAHRHTAGAIYHVVQGRGRSVVNGQTLEWEDKDVFAVPGWNYHEHANASDTEPAVLFSFTEGPGAARPQPAPRAGPPRRASIGKEFTQFSYHPLP